MSLTEQIEKKIDKGVTGGLAVIGTGGALNIMPTSLTEVMECAKLMAISDFAVRPRFRNNVGACFALSMFAFRIGMDPYAVANKAYITKSKHTGEEQIAYESQLVHGIIISRAPIARRLRESYTGDGPTRRCKIQGWLKGEDDPFEYESPMVKDITVKNSPLWVSDPDQQLFYYSSRAWARRHCPDVLMGVYTPDEIGYVDTYYDQVAGGEVSTPARPRRADFQAPPVEEKKLDPFEVVNSDGEIAMFVAADQAVGQFITLMVQAKRASGAKGVDGLWDSNGLLLTQLRESGNANFADELHTEYDRLTQAPKVEPKPEPEKAQERQQERDQQADRRAAGGEASPTQGDQQTAQNIEQEQARREQESKRLKAEADAHMAAAEKAKKAQPADLLSGSAREQAEQRETATKSVSRAPNSPLGKSGAMGNWLAWSPWFLDKLKTIPAAQVTDFIMQYTEELDFMAQHRTQDYQEADRIIEARRKETA